MEFRLLGPLEVVDNGSVIELRGSKPRAVLALLVLHANEVIRTDRLIEDLWGGRPPANASAALHNHVSRLRKGLGSDVVVTKPWGYVLRADPDAIDLRRFERLVAEAKPLAAHERAALLAEALTLWRGAPLADLAQEPALASEIPRLEELRLSAIEQRIDAELELGHHEEVVPQLEALVGEEPLRERLRGQLILALYRSGRQAEALETYRETRRVLVEELGIEPSPELRELERAILRQDPSLAAATPIVARRAQVVVEESRWRWPRSPFLLGAGVLALLAGAGVTAGIFATRGGVSHEQAAAASLPPASQHPVTVTTPGPRTIVEIHETTLKEPASQPRSKPVSHDAHPRTTRAVRTTPSKRAAAVTPKPVKKPTPKVYWLSDNFEDPTFNSGMWHIASHGSGVEVAERNGRLELSIASDITTQGIYGTDQHYGTQCRLIGDFDARVQFKLLTWPPTNGTSLEFAVYFPLRDTAEQIAREGRWASGSGWDAYTSSLGWGRIASTNDSTGTLRLTRENGILGGYYRAGRQWIRLGSERAPGPAQLLLELWSNSDRFGHTAASVAFDNFTAIADDVECPGVPVPPQKPRA